MVVGDLRVVREERCWGGADAAQVPGCGSRPRRVVRNWGRWSGRLAAGSEDGQPRREALLLQLVHLFGYVLRDDASARRLLRLRHDTRATGTGDVDGHHAPTLRRSVRPRRSSPGPGRPAAMTLTVGSPPLSDTAHHGGDDQAVYVYAREDPDVWDDELGRRLPARARGRCGLRRRCRAGDRRA